MRKLESELQAATKRSRELEGSLKSRDKDVDTLQRLLEAARTDQAVAAAGRAKAEEAVRKLESELALAKSRMNKDEGQIKNRWAVWGEVWDAALGSLAIQYWLCALTRALTYVVGLGSFMMI